MLGGRVGLRNPEKAGPLYDGQQKENGREALTLLGSVLDLTWLKVGLL